MMPVRLLSVLAATAALGLAGCAQTPSGHAAHHPGVSAPSPGPGMPMSHMDEHMKAMNGMHERMMQAKTPTERNALMTEHANLMQEGMAMMHGMGGRNGPGVTAGGDPAVRQQMMEKRMEMMQSMMQMMVDRMPPASAKP